MGRGSRSANAISNHDIRRSLRRRGTGEWVHQTTPSTQPAMSVAELTAAAQSAVAKTSLRRKIAAARRLRSTGRRQQRCLDLGGELGSELVGDWRRFHRSHGADDQTLQAASTVLTRRLARAIETELRNTHTDMRDVVDSVVRECRLSPVAGPDDRYATVG